MLRGQGLGKSVSSVERGDRRARTRQARGARLHIELSRSMRHRRYGFSRARSLFLRACYRRGRPGDCGWTRHEPTGRTSPAYRGSTQCIDKSFVHAASRMAGPASTHYCLAAEGKLNQQIAQELGISRPTVQLWRERFLALRLAGLQKDAPRPGRLPRISAQKVRSLIKATLESKPA